LSLKFTRFTAALLSGAAIAGGALVATAGSASAEPCGYWRGGNWLAGYNYNYRHCADTRVWVRVTYNNNTSEDYCSGPWEHRRLSWRTTGAHSGGTLC
jgi:hypothetical protein